MTSGDRINTWRRAGQRCRGEREIGVDDLRRSERSKWWPAVWDISSSLWGPDSLTIDSGGDAGSERHRGRQADGGFQRCVGYAWPVAANKNSPPPSAASRRATPSTFSTSSATGASLNAKDQLVIVNGATAVTILQLSGCPTAERDIHGRNRPARRHEHHPARRLRCGSAAGGRFPHPSTHAMVAAMAGPGAAAGSAVAATAPDECRRPTPPRVEGSTGLTTGSHIRRVHQPATDPLDTGRPRPVGATGRRVDHRACCRWRRGRGRPRSNRGGFEHLLPQGASVRTHLFVAKRAESWGGGRKGPFSPVASVSPQFAGRFLGLAGLEFIGGSLIRPW